MDKPLALVVGGGPAGLMAADRLQEADPNGRVMICDAMPTLGRKFLMAGKSGLNITKDEPDAAFLRAFYEAAPRMAPMLAAMGPHAVKRFAEGLGQPVFTGSSGMVFPSAMKASPLLRAWIARLEAKGAEIRPRWRWTGFEDGGLAFDTPGGPQTVKADATVLALGGASWQRLGSNGAWVPWLVAEGVDVSPFKPANMGLSVDWTEPMRAHIGAAIKPVILSTPHGGQRGEFVITAQGVEGTGVYAIARDAREGVPITIDLVPDVSLAEAAERLGRPRGKASMANHLRKALRLEGAKRALLMEFGRPLPEHPEALANLIKALPLRHDGPRPMDEAISTAGGVSWDAVDSNLMLTARPGVFCAGEMLDWEAPTGGYLITGSLATGAWAGAAAARFIAK